MKKIAHKKNNKKADETSAKQANEAREHSAKKTTKKTSPWHILLNVIGIVIWVAVVLTAVEYAVSYSLYFLLGRELILTPVWMTVCNATIYALTLFLTIWIPVKFFKKKRPTREELGIKGLPTWSDIGLAPVGFVVYLILAMILVALFQFLPFFDPEQTQELGYEALNNGFNRVVAFFALCIVAPVAEELIFRGWLYAKLRTIIPGKHLSLFLSILIVSIFFGIMHGQWNVGVNVFAMSIVLCALREITGTVYSGIILHVIKNTVAFVLLYIIGFH